MSENKYRDMLKSISHRGFTELHINNFAVPPVKYIVAPNLNIYRLFCRNYELDPHNTRYITQVSEVYGLQGTVVIVIGDERGSYVFPRQYYEYLWEALHVNPYVEMKYMTVEPATPTLDTPTPPAG